MYSSPLYFHQGSEGKVLVLEKKLAELKAENKPISITLKHLIQALCAEEVGFILMSCKTQFFFLKLVCFVCGACFSPIVVWSEPATGPWAEAAAWGGDDSRGLCHPHQPVLSPQQCGGGTQPEEGSVSSTGYTYQHWKKKENIRQHWDQQ